MAAPRKYANPIEQLRELLHESREAGLDFDAAWRRARRPGCKPVMVTDPDPPDGAVRWPSDRADRVGWLAAVDECEEAWRSAYDRMPQQSRERAVGIIGDSLRAPDDGSDDLGSEAAVG